MPYPGPAAWRPSSSCRSPSECARSSAAVGAVAHRLPRAPTAAPRPARIPAVQQGGRLYRLHTTATVTLLHPLPTTLMEQAGWPGLRCMTPFCRGPRPPHSTSLCTYGFYPHIQHWTRNLTLTRTRNGYPKQYTYYWRLIRKNKSGKHIN